MWTLLLYAEPTICMSCGSCGSRALSEETCLCGFHCLLNEEGRTHLRAESMRSYFLPSRFYSREYPFTRVKAGMVRGLHLGVIFPRGMTCTYFSIVCHRLCQDAHAAECTALAVARS